MTYTRVIPRDLFNEGDLLNCLGRLWLKLDERRDHSARMRHRHEAGPFNIDQDPSDGSISCENVLLKIDGRHVHLFRPLNARSKWPLWCRDDIDDVRVFDEAGDLDPEFVVLISQPGLTAQRRARAKAEA